MACTSVIDLIMNHQRHRGDTQKSNVTIGEKTLISPKEDFSANPGFRRRKGKSTVDDPTWVVPRETAMSRSQLSGFLLYFVSQFCYLLFAGNNQFLNITMLGRRSHYLIPSGPSAWHIPGFSNPTLS